MQTLIDSLFSNARIFDMVRDFLEDDFRSHRSQLRRWLDVRKSTIDIGCGTGIFAGAFKGRYLGVDISPKYITRARSFRGKQFEVMDATNLRVPAQSFEQFVIIGLLHHLDDHTAKQILREARRVVRHGGTGVIFEDISATNPIGQLVNKLDSGKHIRSAHAYGALIGQFFDITDQSIFSSGFMRYAAFRVRKRLEH